MADRQIIVDSCENGDHPCPMFDTEMATCNLADSLGIDEEVSCTQARYGYTDEECCDWHSKVAQARDNEEQEPELPKNPIPFPENCPLKAGPYTGPWTIELIIPDG